jgi:endogenous inhibitor of DNA gyrase (YacG/DUF329 family)
MITACYTQGMSAVCPICQKKAEGREQNPSWPFCSARCKTIDLAKWLGGDYRIETNERADDPSNETTLTAGNRKEMS